MRHLVILNPAAGQGRAAKAEPRVRQLLDRSRIDYELRRSEGPMHAAEIAANAASDGFDVVVGAGGDGTCNEIVNGLMSIDPGTTRPAVGVLSIGRGNDFAYGVGIPQELDGAVRTLSVGFRRTVDLGRLSGCGDVDPRYFCNGLGIGFDAIVALEASRMRAVGGFLGYVLAALKTIVAFPQPPRVTLRYQGNETARDAMQISIMSGKRMGGAFYMAPRSQPDDGELDLTLASKVGRAEMVRLFLRFLKGTQESHPAITMARAARFEINAIEGPLLVHADGEPICTDGRVVVAEDVPQAIEVVCSQRSSP